MKAYKKAYKKPISMILAMLMLVGIVFQSGLGTITSKAANNKTHCLYFTDANDVGMTNVTVQFGVAKDEQSVVWQNAVNCGDGRYEFTYDFDLLENDHDNLLYTHWDTHGIMVAPVNGMASSLTSCNNYNNLSAMYAGGKQWDFTQTHEYDFFSSYSAQVQPMTPDQANPYPNGLELCFMFDEYNGVIMPDENGYVHWDQGRSTQSQRSGGFPFIARTNVNGVCTPINDSDASRFTADKGMSITTDNKKVINGADSYTIFYWNTPKPDWYTISYAGFSKWIEIQSEWNPGPGQDDSTGLKAVWGINLEEREFWNEDPWWDGPYAWQSIDCTEFYFVLKCINDDKSEVRIDGSNLDDLSISSASGINRMVISDTGLRTKKDGYPILKWVIPYELDTYTLSYNGKDLEVDIRYSMFGLYGTSVQGLGSYMRDVSFDKDKHFYFLADIETCPDELSINSLYVEYENPDYDGNDPDSEYWIREDSSDGITSFVKNYTIIRDASGKIIGYEVTLEDEWPNKLNKLFEFRLGVEYTNKYSNGIKYDDYWISRYTNQGGPGYPVGPQLLFTNWIKYSTNGSADMGDSNGDGSITVDDIGCGSYYQDYVWGREADFVFRFLDAENNSSVVSLQDLIIPRGMSMFDTGKTVTVDGVRYPIYHMSIQDKGTKYYIDMKNTNSRVDINIKAPEVAFYDSDHVDYDRLYEYVEVEDEDEGFISRMPANVTYLSSKPIYVIASAMQGYWDGSVLDSLTAKYYDDDQDRFVSFDMSAVCDVEWIYGNLDEEICTDPVKVAAKITFKNEWPSMLKNVEEFRIIANSKFYDMGGINSELSDNQESVYVKRFFAGCDASLDDNINLNFVVSLDAMLVNDASTKIVLDCGTRKYEYSSSDFEKYAVKPDGWGYPRYAFPCELAASQMSQNIEMTLFSRGEKVSTSNVRFADYVSYIKNSQNSSFDMVELANALLNYGGYAQQYFGTNIDKPANGGLYDDGEDPVKNTSSNVIKAEIEEKYAGTNILREIVPENDIVEVLGTSLVCRDKISLNAYFIVDSRVDINNLRVSGYDNIIAEKIGSSVLKVTISGIGACNLAEIFEFAIVDTAGNSEVIVRVTPFSYIYSAQDSDNTALVDLTKAIYLYQQAAYTYTLNLAHDEWETDIL